MMNEIISSNIVGETATSTTPIFQLSAADRIPSLKAKIFALKSLQPNFKPIIKTQSQKRGTSTKFNKDQQKSSTTVPLPTALESNEPSTFKHEHPFKAANNTNYKPPQLRNFGAAPASKPPSTTRPDTPTVATKMTTLSNIEDISKMLFKQSLDAMITVTPRELLAISLDLREHY